MAKLRFPGKALKLNQRKRTKFNHFNELTPEELRLIQIKKGLRLFRSVFGDSEEDDFEGFEPISISDESQHAAFKNKNISNKKKKEQLLSYLNKHYNNDSLLEYNSHSKKKPNTTKSYISKKLQKPIKRYEQDVNSHGSEASISNFVLPNKSARSSRIIIPNKRIFGDNASCNKIPARLNSFQNGIPPENEESSEGEVPTSISLYTSHITEESEDLPPGNSRKTSRRGIKDYQIREKIEKILRSPWDSRLKKTQSHKVPEIKYSSENQVAAGTDILRKPRLNISKKTLQKIRSTSSNKKPHSNSAFKNDILDGKCGFCQMVHTSRKTNKYGVSCCQACSSSISDMVEIEDSNKYCIGAQGKCQLVGLSYKERCKACWIARVLISCTMPNLLHDRLRKQLPNVLKELVPSSLGRSTNKSKLSESYDVSVDGNAFGSSINLPGGWKRKVGRNTITVISPSGEKFKSIAKLDEYLERQGISADATVLFGNILQNTSMKLHSSSKGHPKGKQNKSISTKSGMSNVVITTLPGGWERKIKWRPSGHKFDTFVCSPDGKTFKYPKDLYAYFQRIGKRDDIHKYFPINNLETSNDNSEFSSCEPYSGSEMSSDDISNYISEHGSDCDVNQMLSSDLSCSESDSPSSQIIISNFETDASGTEQICETVEESSSEENVEDVSAINILSLLSAEENANEVSVGNHKQTLETKYRRRKSGLDYVKFNNRITVTNVVQQYAPCPKSKKPFNKSVNDTNTVENSNFYSSLDNLISDSTVMNPNIPLIDQSYKTNSYKKNEVGESMVIKEKIPTICKKKLATFTTERFGENWSRKIKWDADGNGKISYITNPEGQKIHSSIELIAYFKKAGKPPQAMDFFFPTTIIRSQIELKPDKKVCKKKLTVIESGSLDLQEKTAVDSINGKKMSRRKSLDRTASEKGPRVKNVCRSAAQALSLPRAVFPVESLRTDSNSTLKRTKTINACNECTGCLTKNCLKCSNCLDMKKNGGKGSKKKRCRLRKCLNPKKVARQSDKSAESDGNCLPTAYSNSDVDASYNGDLYVDRENSLSDDISNTRSLLKKAHTKSNATEKGKKGDHGTPLNIDYWHDYCTEDTTMTGFPIITTELPDVEAFCFRCGSAGQEKLIFCSLCCEGIHPFCLEEGELAESQIEEAEDIWVCRRCVVCHVCGTAGCEQLMQCSVCMKYFHLDCIGPAHHMGCEDKMNAWERDLFAILSGSWVSQCPIYEVGADSSIQETDIQLLEDLMSPQSVMTYNYKSMIYSELSGSPRKKDAISRLVESVSIDEKELNLEEECSFTICLEDEYEVTADSIGTENFLDLTINDHLGMDDGLPSYKYEVSDDEYHQLKYCRILPYGGARSSLSLRIWLNLVQADLFEVLEFPSWADLVTEGLLPCESRYLPQDTEDVDIQDHYTACLLKRIIANHRYEMKEYWAELKDLEKRKIEMENHAFKMFRNLLKDKERLANREYQTIPSSPEESKENHYSSEDGIDFEEAFNEDFIVYDEFDEEQWQPKSWQDFDIMLKLFVSKFPKLDEKLNDLIESGVYLDNLDRPMNSPNNCVSKRTSNIPLFGDDKRLKLDSTLLSPRSMDRTIKRARSSVCRVKLTKINFDIAKDNGFSFPVDNDIKNCSSDLKLDSLKTPLEVDTQKITLMEVDVQNTTPMEVDVQNTTPMEVDVQITTPMEVEPKEYMDLENKPSQIEKYTSMERAPKTHLQNKRKRKKNAQKPVDSLKNTLMEASTSESSLETKCLVVDSLETSSSKFDPVDITILEVDPLDITSLDVSQSETNMEKINPQHNPSRGEIRLPADETFPTEPEKRLRRRTFGRVSELASLRKSKMDM